MQAVGVVMELQTLLITALAYGGVLSVVLSVLILGSLRLSAESWVGDYPKDIQEKYGPMSERGQRLKWVFGLPILILPLVFGGALLVRLQEISGSPVPYWPAALAVFVMWMVFNLVDLLVIDWLIMVYLQPRFIVLPGTEGMAGYRDYAFHFRAFLIGVVLCTGAALVVAGVYRLLAA